MILFSFVLYAFLTRQCPSDAFVHSFVLTDLVTMIPHERLEQSG